MVFIESDDEKTRKGAIEAYKKADEQKKKEIFSADVAKAAGFKVVGEKLKKNKWVEVVVTDQGFEPHILKDDVVSVERQEAGKYKSDDFVLYEGTGKIRFGLIKKISRKTAGGSVIVEYARRETETIKENKILGKVVHLERCNFTIKLRAGIKGKILELLGY